MTMKKIILLVFLIFGICFSLLAFDIKEKTHEPPLFTPIHTWTGMVSSEWYLAGNWSPASVPSPTDDVIIPIGKTNDPTVSRNNVVICRNATILHCTDKSVTSTNKGFTISGGEIIIDGTLTITPSAILIIGSDGALTVNGNLKISFGGTMIVESGGSLITTGLVSGSARIKREVSGELRWHFLSSPVGIQAILNGEFAPLLVNFSSTPSTCYDFYKFNSTCDPLHWINLRNANMSLNTSDFGVTPVFEVKKGYLVAYNACLPKIKTFLGTPNTGDYIYTLTVGLPLCSWDLLGNPYPSAFQWGEVLGKSNLSSGYYYVWNENKPGGPGYESYLDDTHSTPGVNGNIPSMQGFFVKVRVPGSTITVPNNSRIHDGNNWLKSTKDASPDKLKLTFSNSTNFDDTYVMFESNGSLGADWYDAEKMFSLDEKIPQVYTIANNDQKNVINSLPVISSPVTVPVGIFVPNDGDYTLTVSGIENFTTIPGIILEDLKTSNTQNLLQQPVYNFKASPDDEGKRFLIHFFGSSGNNNPQDSNPISIYCYGNSLFISCSTGMQNGRVSLSNMIGQQILFQRLNDQTLNEVKLDVSNGYYIVRVQTDEYIKTIKVFLK